MALLDIKYLTKKYGNFTAIKEISFQVNAGEIVALIGENGAGKTTLLNCLAGSISITEGTISYRGQSLLEKDSLRNEFGFLIQASFFDYMNAYDNLDILLELSGESDKNIKNKRIMDLLTLVGLESKRKDYVKTFSFGMKQRLGLAQALIHQPHFLVLDEPFVGLDPIGKTILKNVIKEKAKNEMAGILFSSHDLEDVLEICDRVVMIKKGIITYDNVFRPKKRYFIQLVHEKDAIWIAEKEKKITREDKKIICTNFEIFQKVYEEVWKAGICMQDIEIQEDSLYDFFDGGDYDDSFS